MLSQTKLNKKLLISGFFAFSTQCFAQGVPPAPPSMSAGPIPPLEQPMQPIQPVGVMQPVPVVGATAAAPINPSVPAQPVSTSGVGSSQGLIKELIEIEARNLLKQAKGEGKSDSSMPAPLPAPAFNPMNPANGMPFPGRAMPGMPPLGGAPFGSGGSDEFRWLNSVSFNGKTVADIEAPDGGVFTVKEGSTLDGLVVTKITRDGVWVKKTKGKTKEFKLKPSYTHNTPSISTPRSTAPIIPTPGTFADSTTPGRK